MNNKWEKDGRQQGQKREEYERKDGQNNQDGRQEKYGSQKEKHGQQQGGKTYGETNKGYTGQKEGASDSDYNQNQNEYGRKNR